MMLVDITVPSYGYISRVSEQPRSVTMVLLFG